MSPSKKLPYTKPELIVLERSRPEESVLHACKYRGPECCESKISTKSSSAVRSMGIDPGIPTIVIGEHGAWCSCMTETCNDRCMGRHNS